MIASDLHGSAYFCRKLMDRFDKEEADALISEKVKAIVKDVKGYSGYEYQFIRPVALNDGEVGAVYGVVIRSSYDLYDICL